MAGKPTGMSIKRSELYDRVWSTPMTKLAKELGISDVGLAKACRRHAVPVPPRGYWAKRSAGHKPRKTPLPAPELDVVVHFAITEPEERARQRAMAEQHQEMLQRQADEVAKLPSIVFAADLERAHPLVKATHEYCERIPQLVAKAKKNKVSFWSPADPQDRLPPEQHGRYHFLYRDLLDINASLDSMSWVLRFHATLFGAWVAAGASVSRKEKADDRQSSPSSSPIVEMHLQGESLAFKFSEGYRRERLTPAELSAKKREYSWASEYVMRPSGKFTFSIQGSEYQASKAWQGSREKLQEMVGEIAHTAVQFALMQPQYRKERKEREADARRAEEVRATEQRRREARAEQLKNAFKMMDADIRVRRLEEYLGRLEEGAHAFRPPFDQRMKVWIQVVRTELLNRNPVDEIIDDCLSAPSWGTWPPAWWPSDPIATEGN